MNEEEPGHIPLPQFVRVFHIRGPTVMCLFIVIYLFTSRRYVHVVLNITRSLRVAHKYVERMWNCSAI